MGSTILVGSQNGQEKAISEYIKKYSVKNYNVVHFSDKITISNAREIKHLLSRAASGVRMIILHDDITVEAQNALLKTLEELSDEAIILFAVNSSDKLIPTIISRSQIIRLPDSNGESDDFPYKKDLEGYISEEDLEKKIGMGFCLSEKISSGNRIDGLIMFLRESMFEDIEKQSLRNLKNRTKLLKTIFEYYDLIISNNLNKRLFLDYVFSVAA